MDEYIDILTERGENAAKVILKSEAHRLGLWHASAQVWILNTKREVLLQKRASNKDSYPNLWDISVAGHLIAGDTAKKAAVREIYEEIGIRVAESELIYLKKLKRSKVPKAGFLDNEFNYLFAVVKDIFESDMKLQQEEVAAVKWVSIDDFEQQLMDNTDVFVPHGNQYYKYIISELKKL